MREGGRRAGQGRRIVSSATSLTFDRKIAVNAELVESDVRLVRRIETSRGSLWDSRTDAWTL